MGQCLWSVLRSRFQVVQTKQPARWDRIFKYSHLTSSPGPIWWDKRMRLEVFVSFARWKRSVDYEYRITWNFSWCYRIWLFHGKGVKNYPLIISVFLSWVFGRSGSNFARAHSKGPKITKSYYLDSLNSRAVH